MSIEINVPDIGADEVEVTEIMVKVGDTVTVEQSLIAVEGDKASMEVPSPQAGVVKEIKVAVGDKVETGKLIMVFESATGAVAAPAKAEEKVAAVTPAPAVSVVKDVAVPDIGSDEVEVTEIMVKVGDTVTVEQSLIAVEGDKASMEVPSPQAGVVKEIKVAVGDKVETGKLIMVFESATGAVAAPAKAEEKVAAVTPAPAVSVVKDVAVPDIGSDEVEVTEIMVKVGDRIEAEQSLISVEGDKASMEVPAPFAGIVKEIKIATGDKVSTGSLIMVFEVAGAAAPVATAPAPAAVAPAASAAKNVEVPDIGDDEVEVTEVMVKVGDKVTAEQSLITVEGDKASMEVPAPFAGTVKEIKISTGDKVKTGSLIMVFDVEGAAPAAAPAQQTVAPAAAPAKVAAPAVKAESKGEFTENDAYVHATPVIRRLAREFGVNLAKVKGTGRKGRILREDVQAYVKDAVKRAEAAPAAVAGGGLPGMLPWPKVDFSKFGEIEEVELGRIQKISGANLSRNWVMIPHVTQFDEADITEVEAFRKQQNIEAEKKKQDLKITPLVFLMKAVAKALEEFPRFNSSISEDGQKLTLKKYINVGVAVDTPNGLVVPVFRDVNKKGIVELSRELAVISKKARDGKLTASDMQGGCFTISSLGGIGGTAFTPIVNAPEVAILGVSKSSMKPVWNGKEFAPRLMLPLSLSFDHRVIDGVAGARFAAYIATIMADIRRLVM
ncbi:pyruvate dehydrogenase complex dihydrolipoyllysine-residue acetyltransferase [Yersinia ruckeri]|uniref:pyruvate dehydrogenase complex dihydrolipoyllysine-residue acetyltransferase n=1 Tax=Yersinia ruckeri TaxID=29486 RepID=UPI001F424E2C|nr:pyruvate dehydrogenase complex dihydrolipoyllysine-residue acetyltransferase [Yersinia ruckeri]UIN01375.1 pyruvate dehydrogenase complex dihydrolipoyllysine-residue acetyltransferase [Yersinia ruckeri]